MNTGTPPRVDAYSASGNMIYDGSNSYAYDPENRVCAVQSSSGITKYIYDASGNRVAAGSGSNLDSSYSGFQMTREYVYSGNGIATEFSVSGSTETVKYSNVYAGGKMLATYQGSTATQFNFTDWLGTKRVETSYQGVVTSTSSSLPFGDYLAVSGTDTNENHFTGKERDSESKLDYFGARYYNSDMGRFMSPDWSPGAEAVPYAKLDDPQSLNLYAYVRNNPLTGIDVEGHSPEDLKPMHYDQLMNESIASWDEQLDRDRWQARQDAARVQHQNLVHHSKLKVGNITLDVEYQAGGKELFSNMEGGMEITATPEQGCDDCMWGQTVTRTGTGEAIDQNRKDGPGPGPLYGEEGGPRNQFSDWPTMRPGTYGTFKGIAVIGKTDLKSKSFASYGAIVYGFSVDKTGTRITTAPRVATPKEYAHAMSSLAAAGASEGWQVH